MNRRHQYIPKLQQKAKEETAREEPDDILNETIFAEKPLQDKKEEFKTEAQENREQKKKYKQFVSSIEDIKKAGLFGAAIILNVNKKIKDRRLHLQEREAISIAEPTYRLFDRNVLSKLQDILPEIGDDNLRDIKEIATALANWGIRVLMVSIIDYTTRTEEQIAKSQLNTMNIQDEIRRRQEEAHKKFEEKEEANKETEYFGAFNSKDESLNAISLDPNLLDPYEIGALNDGAIGV